MNHHALWPIAFAFAILFMMVGFNDIEAKKQETIVIKACVESGGEWIRDTLSYYECRKK